VAGRRSNSDLPQPDRDRGGLVAEPKPQAGGVVAGVQDQQRDRLLACRQASNQRSDLADGDVVVVVRRMQPAGGQRGGPAVTGEAELTAPLERPASHDRLAGRVPRRLVVIAALGAGLGVATGPGADIDRVDWLAVVEWVAGQQVAECLDVHTAVGEGSVGAGPAPLVDHLQA
jgi:hypothetical protein